MTTIQTDKVAVPAHVVPGAVPLPRQTGGAEPASPTFNASPHGLLHWLRIVFFDSLLQALLLALMGSTVCRVLLFPINLFLDSTGYGDYAVALVVFLVGSGILAYRHPDFSFWRGVVCFMWLITFDVCRRRLLNYPSGLLPWSTSGWDTLSLSIGAGSLGCGLSSALGARARHGMRGWLHEEVMEFIISLGILPEDDGFQDADEAQEEISEVSRQAVSSARGIRSLGFYSAHNTLGIMLAPASPIALEEELPMVRDAVLCWHRGLAGEAEFIVFTVIAAVPVREKFAEWLEQATAAEDRLGQVLRDLQVRLSLLDAEDVQVLPSEN